jgi:hypothetical protein
MFTDTCRLVVMSCEWYSCLKRPLLSHYLAMMDKGASFEVSGDCSWQSTVRSPPKFTKFEKYFQGIQPGFCECKVVGPSAGAKDWNSVFPKIAALAGFRKDKKIPKKGWIRYSNNILLVIVGSGSPCSSPKAPKGTAFEGQSCHAPGPLDTILFRVQEKIASIHDIFCKVAGLLQTL